MTTISRRDLLKLSGATLGGLALGGTLAGCGSDSAAAPVINKTEQNSMLASLPPYIPGSEKLASDEMRVSFMGSTCIPMISQAAISIFVELGNGDSFVFDMGTGSVIKYWAMGVNLDRMDKIFLTHLHADHMGDLPFVYGFGPSYGRYWPLYIFGPSDSGLVYTDPDGKTRGPFADGTKGYCDALEKMMYWHNESQAFLFTGYKDYPIPPFDPEPGKDRRDAYSLVPIELDWKKSGRDAAGNLNGDNVAFNYRGVKITHFPVVHCRAGSIGYKLEWNGLSMIYTGDTLPNYYTLDQASSGVDLLIHEIVMPADRWVAKMGIDPATHPNAVQQSQNVQDSSHTPQKAYGYMLEQLRQRGKAPRLAVGTHFQATDDTIELAMSDIRKWYSQGDLIIGADTMVLNITKKEIIKRRAVVSNHAWPKNNINIPYSSPEKPKYWKVVDPVTGRVDGDPIAQLDPEQYKQVIDKSLYNSR